MLGIPSCPLGPRELAQASSLVLCPSGTSLLTWVLGGVRGSGKKDASQTGEPSGIRRSACCSLTQWAQGSLLRPWAWLSALWGPLWPSRCLPPYRTYSVCIGPTVWEEGSRRKSQALGRSHLGFKGSGNLPCILPTRPQGASWGPRCDPPHPKAGETTEGSARMNPSPNPQPGPFPAEWFLKQDPSPA